MRLVLVNGAPGRNRSSRASQLINPPTARDLLPTFPRWRNRLCQRLVKQSLQEGPLRITRRPLRSLLTSDVPISIIGLCVMVQIRCRNVRSKPDNKLRKPSCKREASHVDVKGNGTNACPGQLSQRVPRQPRQVLFRQPDRVEFGMSSYTENVPARASEIAPRSRAPADRSSHLPAAPPR